MGIFELRVWRGDSVQSWRFAVAFGVNIPSIYCNVINRKKITLRQTEKQTDRGHKDGHRQTEQTPFLYLYYKVICII